MNVETCSNPTVTNSECHSMNDVKQLSVDDPNMLFIWNIHVDNFAV